VELLLAAVCERIQTEPDGRFSIIGVTERLIVPSLPATITPPLVFAMSFRYSRSEAGQPLPLRLVFVDPDGDPRGEVQQPVAFPQLPAPDSERGYIVVPASLQSMGVYVVGDHEFQVFLGGELLRSVPLEIELSGA
jgi:hypothetical protein